MCDFWGLVLLSWPAKGKFLTMAVLAIVTGTVVVLPLLSCCAANLLGLLADLLASAFLSAVATTFSALRISIWLKWGLAALGIYLILMKLYSVANGIAMGNSGAPSPAQWLGSIAYVALLLLLLLQMGAIAIAPVSENHATRIRLLVIAIAGAGAALFIGLGSTWESTVEVVTTAIVASVCIAGLCEPIRRIPSLYAPFFGPPGLRRVAGVFLSPGWPSAVPFTIIVCLLISWGFGWWSEGEGVPRVLSLIGALMLPLALIKTFPRLFARFPRTLATYLILLMATGIPDYLYFAGKILNRPLLAAVAVSASAFAPLSYFALSLMPSHFDNWQTWESVVQLLLCLASTLVVAAHARHGWTQIAGIVSETRSAPAVPADLAVLDLHQDP